MEGLARGVVIAGKYRLEHPLAQGGMGAVWAAFDTGLEVPVAVKFMAPALAGSAELVGRFEREAKAAAQLRSPHVVQVFEHGVDRGVPYIVMERLEGEDLGTRLKQRGRLSLWESAVILEQVCKALRKAHDAGIVHRDLKPANIFLARHDEDEIVKVLDFGIAKSAHVSSGGEGTRTGVVMGSPAYMSPEQVRSTRAVDHRSDLWSLGLVMFRVVTGKMAFAGETDADTIVRLCSDPVPVPSQVAPDLPPEVDAWFARALSRDLDRRFQSAREMAAAFGRLVGRVPSLGEQAAGPSVPVVQMPPAIEVTASDIARTVKLASERLDTVPLPAPSAPDPTAPLPIATPIAEVAATGATLTNAGSEAVPAQPPSRGGVMWGLLGGAALAALATAGLFAQRSARLGAAAARPSGEVVVAASVGPPEVPSAAPTARAVASASVTVAPVETAEAAPSASATAPRVAPAVTSAPRVGRRTTTAKPAAADTPAGGDGMLEIPRVLKKP